MFKYSKDGVVFRISRTTSIQDFRHNHQISIMNILERFLGHLIRIILWIIFQILQFFVGIRAFFKRLHPVRSCPPITDELLFYPATILAEKIRKREVTSEDVIKMYISRIKEINPLINAVVEERFSEAIEDARNTDRFLSNTPLTIDELKRQFPLLGLPLTIKESIGVERMSNGAGQVFPQKKVAHKDSDIVKHCKDAGAIILLVSNTPELCLNWESYNYVTGRTNNPYDLRRTPGGSSGGEAALISSGASLLGLGSDIAGSLRIPAFFCGIFGHKPTAEIVSIQGHYPGSSDTDMWKQLLVLGPVARYAIDLPLIMNVIVHEDLKSTLRLHEPVELNQLNVFYMENDGNFLTRKIDREIIERLRQIVAHMKNTHNCSITKVKVKDFQYSPEISFTTLLQIDDVEGTLTDGKSILKEILRSLTFRSRVSSSLIACGILKKFMNVLPKRWLECAENKRQECKTKLNDLLGKNGVLLYPCYNRPAILHGEAIPHVMDGTYLAIINSIGLPATACTVGLHSSGLPIGIQVIASAYNDRMSIAVAQEVERLFGGWVEPAQRSYHLTKS